uniref:Serine protease K12H4.7 n=1 Tax=Caenorhabditis tropicalis TaxID=1561998 RepID=A0A1I7T789_9PELO
MQSVRLLLALGLLAVGLESARHPSLPPYLLGRPTARGFVGHGDRFFDNFDTPIANLTIGTVPQKVDNFDNSNTATYKQRYWYNSNFTRNQNIVFLMIQGESPATDLWISNPNYQYLQWAKEFGADVFQLEHRCFGQSRPYPDTSMPNIKVCTMTQALADIASFIEQMNTHHNFRNPKWITFGGSYPGTLSALFRKQYPQHTVGAVASSAPLDWTLDFFEYAMVVEDVLKQTSNDCWENTNVAFNNMQQLSLNETGIQQLNTYFNLDPPFVKGQYTQHDIDNFFANVYSFFQGVIQYTYDGRNNATLNGLNAQNLCAKMNDATVPDVITRVNNTINWINQLNGDPVGPFQNSYSDMIAVLANATYDDASPVKGEIAANRGWMWLCCNELGVLQTTDQGRNTFMQTVPMGYFIDMCTDMFGPEIDIKYIRDHNKNTLYKYGGADNYKATNVVLPNGAFDPWHVLGTYNSDTNNHMTPLLIQGAAHCSDMYPTYAGEPTDLAKNRAIIHSELKYFLGL